MSDNQTVSSSGSEKSSVETYHFEDDGTFPNNGELPVVVMKKIFSEIENGGPAVIENRFNENGWVNSWRNGLFGYHHYHSTAHEVLGVYKGWVKARLGGPEGETVVLEAGDVVVIPAGVAHKNEDQSADFKVIGAYPIGQHMDMNTGQPGERPKTDRSIAQLPKPETDPIFGMSGGPLAAHWKINAG